MPVEINIRPQLDRAQTKGLSAHLRRVGQRTLRIMDVPKRTLSILVTDDDEMRALNRQWRQLNRTTDVLSFEGGGEVLGDVAISLPCAMRQAERHGVTRDEELARLLIHGTLHLLEHDHRTPAERRAMTALTERILAEVI